MPEAGDQPTDEPDEQVIRDSRYFRKLVARMAYRLYFWVAAIFIGLWIYHYGFSDDLDFDIRFDPWLTTGSLLVLVSLVVYLFAESRGRARHSWYILSVYFLFLVAGTLFFLGRLWPDKSAFWSFWAQHEVFQVLSLAIFLLEISTQSTLLVRLNLGPARILIFSFLLLIATGTFLLKLPNATVNGIEWVDALFMATSAVCITGLAVIDPGQELTAMGQYILLILVQLGGLGIMTFTSFILLFFQRGSTYTNQIYIKDYLSSDRLGDLFSTVLKILLTTFGLELAGAVAIYYSMPATAYRSGEEHMFFAVFHAVSAFCNAGFSLMKDNIYDQHFRFNYSVQFVLMSLFVLGGLGFSVVFNFLSYIRENIARRFRQLFYGERYRRASLLLNLNSRVVLVTTLALILFGSVSYYVIEYNHTLREHTGIGKVVVSMFGATAPRTAGFNNVDMGGLQLPTILLIFLLMWIGGSPGSTGGGIKTTTFAIATLNFISLARGKDRVEIMRREISDLSIRRAFAVIALSIVFIGATVFALTISDSDKGLTDLAFEAFSAYCTVGMSLGITHELSDAGKVIISIAMFIGRLGAMTIIIALLRRVTATRYRYPKEDIFIS